MLQPCLWQVAILGRHELMALPVSDYMVVAQSEGHGLVDIRVVIPEGNSQSELGTRRKAKGLRNEHWRSWRDIPVDTLSVDSSSLSES